MSRRKFCLDILASLVQPKRSDRRASWIFGGVSKPDRRVVLDSGRFSLNRGQGGRRYLVTPGMSGLQVWGKIQEIAGNACSPLFSVTLGGGDASFLCERVCSPESKRVNGADRNRRGEARRGDTSSKSFRIVGSISLRYVIAVRMRKRGAILEVAIAFVGQHIALAGPAVMFSRWFVWPNGR